MRLVSFVSLTVATGLPVSISGALHAQEAPEVRILNASPYVIAADAELSAYVRETAQTAVAEHCAGCHGAVLGNR